jgi:hypothetical protein
MAIKKKPKQRQGKPLQLENKDWARFCTSYRGRGAHRDRTVYRRRGKHQDSTHEDE